MEKILKLLLVICFIFNGKYIYSQTNNLEVNDMNEIIKYGSLAPSSHNAQMWLVKIIGKNKIKIFPNYDRILPFVDPDNRETWISIGAFVENCVLAAQDLGYKSNVITNDSEVIIDFQQNSNIANSNQNINLIKRRLTIRDPYLKRKINNEIINKLSKLSENVLYLPIEDEKSQKIIKYSLAAYSLQMKDTSKLEELAQWMTFSYKEEKERKDGLTPKTLGIRGFKHFLFNLFMSKKSVTEKTFIKSSIASAEKQLHACSGYILITSNDSKSSDLVESGRLLERVWLECANNEIAVHPMSQVLEEQEYYELLKKSLKIEDEIQMVLRIGKVKKYPVRIGKRLDIEDIIIE